jgi:hypothetical protein
MTTSAPDRELLFRRGAGQRPHRLSVSLSEEEYADLMALAAESGLGKAAQPIPARALRYAVLEICRLRRIGRHARVEVGAEQAA